MSSSDNLIYQLKISLIGTPIWRRIRIPEHFTFGQLHVAICQSMNWNNMSRHRFQCAWGAIKDEWTITEIYNEILDKTQYIMYNATTKWMHNIRFERRIQFHSANINQTHAICISGRWARPPEYCGGYTKFNQIREIFADKSHPEYQNVLHYVSRLDDTDAEWTKMDATKIGPITLNV